MNWISELGKIEDYTFVSYGLIEGLDCGEDDENVINIYKIMNGENKLIENLAYTKYIPKFGDKWDFIEKYWMKNYRKFTDEKL
jgi:hypothetical protein